MKKKICFVTGSRADYGNLRYLISFNYTLLNLIWPLEWEEEDNLYFANIMILFY